MGWFSEESVHDFMELVVTSYWGGLLCILVGVFNIKYFYRKGKELHDRDSYFYYAHWGGSAMLIIAGVVIFYLKIFGD